MESTLLSVLEFNLTVPSPLRFLERLLVVTKADENLRNLAMYLLELTLPSYKMLKYKASQHAAAAFYLARACMKLRWVSSPCRFAYVVVGLRVVFRVSHSNSAVFLGVNRTRKWSASRDTKRRS